MTEDDPGAVREISPSQADATVSAEGCKCMRWIAAFASQNMKRRFSGKHPISAYRRLLRHAVWPLELDSVCNGCVWSTEDSSVS